MCPLPAAAIPGPTTLSTGFVDQSVFEESTTSVAALWAHRAHGLGSSWIRLAVEWNQIAPFSLPRGFKATNAGDPRYRWTALDAAVRTATAQREHVLLAVTYAPKWAEGAHRPASDPFAGNWRPSASALGAFAHALASRYSGRFPDPLHRGKKLPRVTDFQAWNEPNLRLYIMPQWTRTSHGGWTPASPAIYRSMLNAFYANVKSVQRHAYVLSAGTAPYGDPPGVDRMNPVTFLSELMCLHGPRLRRERCPNPPHFDALDHHPYGLTPTIHARNAGDVSLPDLGKIQRIVRAARRSHRVLPRGSKPIWITEVDWGTHPPDPRGIPISRQTRYLSLAFYTLWRQGVSHMFWFLIRDPLTPDKGFTGGGVYFTTGKAKPSASAFRFPFVALPSHGKILTLWGRAPARGVVSVQRHTRAGWKTVARVSTTKGGVFYASRRLGRHLELRAVIRKIASPAWSTG